MSYESVRPVWRAVRDRFQKSMSALKSEELSLKLSDDTSSIGFMVRHNAEVEYMFAEWFFQRKAPEGLIYQTNGPSTDDSAFTDLSELIAFSEASDQYLSQAMESLPDEAWDQPVTSPMGLSTPREALGRVLYHAGLHAGQIALIRKVAGQISRL
ncbi:DinB family protein [Paenibacillus guangzhouensis]|uniref:DinB family protein n=1 Tax=Paenibacillus guangzhouensis TaxID=1473112 RepID=UPI001266BB2D|nr:DinB family protein [Paenibacillus guangzhouensis]